MVGGVAVAAHEYVRATEDVDRCLRSDRDNLDRLANVVVALDGRLSLNVDERSSTPERRLAAVRAATERHHEAG